MRIGDHMRATLFGLLIIASFNTFAQNNCRLAVPFTEGKLLGIDNEVPAILAEKGYEVGFVDELTVQKIDGRDYITYRFTAEGNPQDGYYCVARVSLNRDLKNGKSLILFTEALFAEAPTSIRETCQSAYIQLIEKIPACQ
jgi:hypothetical protein